MINDNAALACPYYRYLNNNGPKGTCVSGCRDEAQCLTLEPRGGWRPRDECGRLVSLEAFYRTLDDHSTCADRRADRPVGEGRHP